MLALKLRDSSGEWYILPGGGQGSEETLPEAVQREVLEETGVQVQCGDLLFVIEGVHGEDFHRVDLVFQCGYRGMLPHGNAGAARPDHLQVGVEWLELSQLHRLPLYPSKLRRAIQRLSQGEPYERYLGNGEIGDPESA